MKLKLSDAKLFLFPIFICVCIANGQDLILYRSNSVERPYLLSRRYLLDATNEVSETITAKSLSVVCQRQDVQLAFSNAFVFRTKISRQPSGAISDISQQMVEAKNIEIALDANKVIIWNGKARLLKELKIPEPLGQTNASGGVEGKAAEQYLITNGIGLPPGYKP